jgi:hypothetical protein
MALSATGAYVRTQPVTVDHAPNSIFCVVYLLCIPRDLVAAPNARGERGMAGAPKPLVTDASAGLDDLSSTVPTFLYSSVALHCGNRRMSRRERIARLPPTGRGQGGRTSVAGHPARPDVAAQIYNQALHTVMVSRFTKGFESYPFYSVAGG